MTSNRGPEGEEDTETYYRRVTHQADWRKTAVQMLVGDTRYGSVVDLISDAEVLAVWLMYGEMPEDEPRSEPDE